MGLCADLQGPGWRKADWGGWAIRGRGMGEGRRPLQSCCVIALFAAATRAGPRVLLGPRSDRRWVGGRRETAFPVPTTPPPQGLPDSGGRELMAILDTVSEVRVPGPLRREGDLVGVQGPRPSRSPGFAGGGGSYIP